MRYLLIAAALLVCAAPEASAQSLAGSDWAASSAGHLAFVTQGNGFVSTLRVLSPDGQVSPAEEITEGADEPEVAVGARGDVIVAWTDREKRLWSRYRPAGGKLGSPELVAPNASALLEALPLALDAVGGAIIAWTPEDGAGGLHVRFRDPASGWGREQTLGGRDVYRPKLAVADNGGAVMAFNRRGPAGRNSEQVVVATRAPDGTFGPAQLLAGPRRSPGSVVVDANERGDAVVAWIENRRAARGEDTFSVHAVFRAPGGRFGRPVELSRREATAPSVAVLESGRMVLAWRDNQRHRIGARVRSSTGVLGGARLLTRRLELNGRPYALAAGRGVVAWSDRVRRTRVIRAAEATDDRGFAPARVIDRARSAFNEPAFAVTPNGLTVVPDPPHWPRDPIRWLQVPLDSRVREVG